MHFPPVSDFPLFLTNFQTLWKILKMLPFPEKFFDFHPPKFLMTFFSHRPQILNFPPVFPVSRKLLFPPTFTNFPPVFEKFTCFLHAFCVFRFPPTLTTMHLCITQCTYWTPLLVIKIIIITITILTMVALILYDRELHSSW